MESRRKRPKITRTFNNNIAENKNTIRDTICETFDTTGWRVTKIHTVEKDPITVVDVTTESNNALKDVAFQIEDDKKSLLNEMFWWKFASELNVNSIPFRGFECDVAWYVVKEALENEYKLNKLRQNKKSVCGSSFVAFRLSEWSKIKDRKMIVAGAHLPLDAHEVLKRDEKIVVVRLPTKIVRHIYKDVELLRFDQQTIEDERIERVLNFSGLTKEVTSYSNKEDLSTKKLRPAPGYYCHNCGSPFHFVQHCEMGRRMKPKGIPKMFLEKSEPVSEKESTLVMDDGTTVRARLLVDGKMI